MKVICDKKKRVEYDIECRVDGYCCKRMEHALTISSSEYYRALIINEYGIKLTLWFPTDYVPSNKYPKKTEDYISFCPFCGEKIE